MLEQQIETHALLDRLQRGAFGYFLEQTNPVNGLVADTSRAASPVSIAVVGFALSSYPVAVERGWMTRAAAIERTLITLRFFWNSPQSEELDATGYKGFYYHFLDIHSGKRIWDCELSLIDSTLLFAGMLTASVYFAGQTAEEAEIRQLADALYRRADWQWACENRPTVAQGWKPKSGFLNYGWDGYSEAALLYVLGLASPTFPLNAKCFAAWSATYQWENIYDHEFLYAGPLFIHQFSHAWIDFRGIQDQFMREKGCDYFENSRRATYVQREYAQRNPHGFAGYAEDCWGLSAGDGPPPGTRKTGNRRDECFGYAARGVPYGPDDGTIAPWAPLASLPFAPEIALPALRAICERFPELVVADRLPAGFNPSLPGHGPAGWVSEGNFGLDQGIIVLMVENFRSGLLWKLMRQCPYIRTGLRRAGFNGGWLVPHKHSEGT